MRKINENVFLKGSTHFIEGLFPPKWTSNQILIINWSAIMGNAFK